MPNVPLSIHKMRQVAATVGHWVMSEGTGTTVADASGNSRTATFGAGSKAPAWVTTGRHKQALSFDGVNDVMTVASAAALTPANISVLLWATLAAAGNYPMFVSKFGVTVLSGYEVRTSAGTRQPEFMVTDGVTQPTALDPGAMTLDQWYFLVGTYDGTNIRIYRDGVLRGTTAFAGGIASDTTPAAALTFGARPNESYFFNGRLDNVQIRNVAMTADEIAAEFQRMTKVAMFA